MRNDRGSKERTDRSRNIHDSERKCTNRFYQSVARAKVETVYWNDEILRRIGSYGWVFSKATTKEDECNTDTHVHRFPVIRMHLCMVQRNLFNIIHWMSCGQKSNEDQSTIGMCSWKEHHERNSKTHGCFDSRLPCPFQPSLSSVLALHKASSFPFYSLILWDHHEVVNNRGSVLYPRRLQNCISRGYNTFIKYECRRVSRWKTNG